MNLPSEIACAGSNHWLEALLLAPDAEAQFQHEIAIMERAEAPDPANLLALAHVMLTIADVAPVLSPRLYITTAQTFIRRAMDLQSLQAEAARAGVLH